jgi:hypothetical protein
MINTSPGYYKDNKPELTELIKAWKLDWCEGNAIKYIRRHKHKNKQYDILKAIWYLTNILEEDYGNKFAESIRRSVEEVTNKTTLKAHRPHREET